MLCYLLVRIFQILFVSGNRRCVVGAIPGTTGTADHIVEMIPPVETLGKEFLVSSLVEKDGDIIRVIGED